MNLCLMAKILAYTKSHLNCSKQNHNSKNLNGFKIYSYIDLRLNHSEIV